VRTLYRNGRVHTRAARDATALLVEDGVIAWLGDEDGARMQSAQREIDLAGGFVAPAFVDAHVHATDTGLTLTGLDLSAAASLVDALRAVEQAARARDGGAVLGAGWDDTRWPEQRPPRAAELDRAGGGAPVYLARVDAHSAAVSSALLAAVPERPPGFAADGWLTGAAHDAVRTAARRLLSAGEIRAYQRAALEHAASLGIACVHEMAGPAISSEDDLRSLLALAVDEPLPEVVGYWAELGAVEKARELGALGAGGDLFCDGSLGSHTAALSEAYADRPESAGHLRFSTEQLADHVLACISAGMQAGFHAIGDAAVDQVLDAVERAGSRLGRPAGTGSRIEHAEYVRDPQRLARSGLLASVQPVFDALWGGPDGMYAARLAPARALQLNRFAALAAAGVPLAFGSDSPVTPLDPWRAIRAAVHPSDPRNGVSPRAAFTAHTRAGWRAAGRVAEGQLAPGSPATFAVWQAGELSVDAPDDRVARWSTDPRAAVPGLPDVAPGAALPSCLLTVRAGTVLFER
jgi:predicted amidohydrolase YtcJ